VLIAHLSDMHVAAPGAGLLQFVDAARVSTPRWHT